MVQAHGVLLEALRLAAITWADLQNAVVDIPFLMRWSTAVTHAVRGQQRSEIMPALRKLLRQQAVAPAIVRATRIVVTVRTDLVIPRRYENDQTLRPLLETWIADWRPNSDAYLRKRLSFCICTLLPAAGLDIELWSADAASRLRDQATALADQLCKTRHHLPHFQAIMRTLAGIQFLPSPSLEARIRADRIRANRTELDEDLHRISCADLEKLYATSQQDALDELFFLALITTGMRIGGFVHMQCRDVAVMQDGRWLVAQDEARTREKGNRWFTFKLHPRVRALLETWLNEKRVYDPSPYVFPGAAGSRTGHLSPEYFQLRFRRVCERAGLSGRQCHPHSLRHSFAHIMLELGNSVDIVSKLLGHTDPAITLKYYLKESSAQASTRLVSSSSSLRLVPNFLQGKPSSQATQNPTEIIQQLQDLMRDV